MTPPARTAKQQAPGALRREAPGASYFLSDLHLARGDDERTRTALEFLRSLKGEAEAVFLVGDVFDLWLGYRSVVFSEMFPVLRCLAELADAGTRVVIFAGNHDPDPGQFFERHLKIEAHERALTLDFGGRRVRVEHGDTIDPRGWWRRAANVVARMRPVRWAARALHPDHAWSVARFVSTGLARYKDYTSLPRPLVDDWFAERVAAGDDVVIIGHYHRAFAHAEVVGGRQREFYVLGDWLRHRTFLRWDGRFELMRYAGPGQPPVALGLGDHPPPPRPPT